MNLNHLLTYRRVVMFTFYGFALQLLTCTLLLANGSTNAQNVLSVKEVSVNMNFENEEITSVFNKIRTNYGYKFVYDKKDIDKSLKIDGQYKEDLLYDVLVDISKLTKLGFRQVNNTITVKKLKNPDFDLGEEGPVEVVTQVTVTGKVTDDSNEGLPGVSIILQGTTQGVITDVDGNYEITIPDENAILVFSFVGYVRQEVEVTGRSEVNVVMPVDIGQLDEVVVVGYGTQKRAKVTSAVTKVESDVLVDRPIVSVAQALSGIDPGINIQPSTSGGGRPGATPEISIRGEYTVDNRAEGQAPLVLVDGFEANIRDVDPNQIESMTILKDAAATAIYGVRAGAGVILITTKGGGRDRPMTFNYRFAGSINAPVSLPDVLSTPEYMEFFNYAAVNEEKYVDNVNDPAFVTTDFFPVFSEEVINRARNGEFPDTNWQEELFGPSAMFQHSLDASGGSNRASYLISLGVLDQNGTNAGADEYQRYNFRTKVDADVTNWLSVGVNMAYTRTEEKNVDPPGGEEDRRPVPHFPVTDEFFGGSGLFVQPADGLTENSIWNAERDLNTINRDVIEMAVSGQLKIAKGLTFDQKANLRIVNSLTDIWQGSIPFVTYDFNGQTGEYILESPNGEPEGPFAAERFLEVRDLRFAHFTAQSLLNYNVELNNAHSISVLAGWQVEDQRSDYFEASRNGFPSDALRRLNVGDLTNWQNYSSGAGGSSEQTRYLSAFARVSYDYKARYLIEGSVRRDGSSNFGPGNQWGTFPAVSVGWNLANESFLNTVNSIDLLKIRASYGETGNPLGGNQQWNQRIATTDGYAFPTGEVGGFRTAFIANPTLGWETVIKRNIAMDLVMWEGRLAFTTEFYNNERIDRLLAQRLPRIAGFGTFQNQGFETNTDGYEFSITHKNKVGEITYNVSANLGWAKNVWSVRADDTQWDNSEVGWPIRNAFGYAMDGWISDQAELDEYLSTFTFQNRTDRWVWIGTPRLVDTGQRDPETLLRTSVPDTVINNFDRILLGNGNVGTYIVGGRVGLNYRGLSFSAIIAGQLTRQAVSNIGNIFENGSNAYTATRDLAFDPENPSDDALFPIPITRDLNYPTRPVIDVEFIRVRNISLSYDFDIKSLIPGIRSLELYLTAENPFIIWTNSPLAEYGFDPEGGVNTAYPLNRATTIGINLGF